MYAVSSRSESILKQRGKQLNGGDNSCHHTLEEDRVACHWRDMHILYAVMIQSLEPRWTQPSIQVASESVSLCPCRIFLLFARLSNCGLFDAATRGPTGRFLNQTPVLATITVLEQDITDYS